MMKTSYRGRVSLLAGLACAMAWVIGATDLRATPIALPASLVDALHRAEPFGGEARDISAGRLNDKWQALARKLDDARVQLALCDGDREHCVSPAALRFLAIVDQARAREGRARLGEINRAINLAIRPVSDLAQYGEEDVWSSPLATCSRGAGDCEDYAIAKVAALRLAGLAANDLRIVSLHDTLHREDHAVAAARLDGHWLVLDNQRMAMIEDADTRFVRPLFVFDDTGIAKYAETPMRVSAPEPLSGASAAADMIATAD
jgi:predicted transglutaminase-like cysteine proteinase